MLLLHLLSQWLYFILCFIVFIPKKQAIRNQTFDDDCPTAHHCLLNNAIPALSEQSAFQPSMKHCFVLE